MLFGILRVLRGKCLMLKQIRRTFNRAKITTHGTDILFLGVRRFSETPCLFRIQGAVELTLPVQPTPGFAHLMPNNPGPFKPLGQISGMGGDPRSPNTYFNTVCGWQSQMFGRGDIT